MVAVALVARALVPELPWAAAIALGAAVAGTMSGWGVIPMLLAVTVGSIALGPALARVTLVASARIGDVGTAVIVQFVSVFAVWLIAERLHLSGILTMVVYAMAVARVAPSLMPARIRIPSYAVWDVAVFVLNVLAFILVGLQLKPIVERLSRATWTEYAWVAAAVCAATILTRIAWVMGAAAFSRWWCRRRPDGTRSPTDAVALPPRSPSPPAATARRPSPTAT